MKPLRVLLADDHAMVRAGLRRLLEEIDGVAVVGEAADGIAARGAAETLKPDIALVDISMPGLNGLELTAWIVANLPATRVVILSAYDDDVYVLEALGAGAQGYLLKRSAPDELAAALAIVADGGRYLGGAVSQALVADLATGDSVRNKPLLTARQRDVLRLICAGKTSREIAAILHVGVRTVETHRAHLMARLGVRDVAGLLRHARRLGLMPDDPGP